MTRLEEYQLRAKEAEDAAAKARFDHEREGYRRIAQGWRALEAGEQQRMKRGR